MLGRRLYGDDEILIKALKLIKHLFVLIAGIN